MAWSVSGSADWDLWGVVMLAAGVSCVIAWFAVLARRLSLRSTNGPLSLLGLAELGFVGAAVLGTLERVQPSETPAPEPEAPGTGEEDDTDREGEVPAPDPATDGAEPPESEGSAQRPTALQIGGALDPVPPLPVDASERRAAVRTALRNARLVYEDDASCKDPAAVGRVWAQMARIPEDDRNARATIVAKRLEECRRQVRWAIMYTVRRTRLAAREAFEQTLATRLSEAHDIKTFIKISGKDHERMRVGSGALDDALAEAIMTEALQAELAALGFERIVLATGKQVWRTDLQPRPESDYIDAELAPYGLHRKLEFAD